MQPLEIRRSFLSETTLQTKSEIDSDLFRALIAEAREYAIFMLDPAGFILTWNEGAKRIKGYTADEIIGKHFSCFYLPEDVQSGRPQIELELAQLQGKYDEEGRRLRRDGSDFWASVVIAPMLYSDGSLRGFSKITRDITAKKAAEKKLLQAMSALEQQRADLARANDLEQQRADLARANNDLEAFAYSVSHDLRAPLRHLDGFAALLRKRNSSQLDAQGQRYVDRITASAKKMGTLIDDLLAFSRLGRASLSWVKLDLYQLVMEVRKELNHDAANRDTANRGVDWRVGELPEVVGDSALIRIVLVNLLSNALKYTRGRPDVRIEIGGLENTADKATIFVRDNGVGFEMEYVGKLFQVFQRLHSEEFEGTGIGLAIVRRVIERHGGDVWAEGLPGVGATFYFSLPRRLEG